MEDVYIKDEGEFTTVCFMTDKAKELIKKELSNEYQDALYGETIFKLDIKNESIKSIISWCISHSLNWKSDCGIKIKEIT